MGWGTPAAANAASATAASGGGSLPSDAKRSPAAANAAARRGSAHAGARASACARVAARPPGGAPAGNGRCCRGDELACCRAPACRCWPPLSSPRCAPPLPPAPLAGCSFASAHTARRT
eukprot:353857-Chlamydomonas_euryale.AAC.3